MAHGQHDIIDNDNINSNAAIAQSKLNMSIASAAGSDPAGTTAQIQAANGLASFNNSQFDVVNGRASLKDNGTPLTKIAQIASDTVLGNSTASTAKRAGARGNLCPRSAGIQHHPHHHQNPQLRSG